MFQVALTGDSSASLSQWHTPLVCDSGTDTRADSRDCVQDPCDGLGCNYTVTLNSAGVFMLQVRTVQVSNHVRLFATAHTMPHTHTHTATHTDTHAQPHAQPRSHTATQPHSQPRVSSTTISVLFLRISTIQRAATTRMCHGSTLFVAPRSTACSATSPQTRSRAWPVPSVATARTRKTAWCW
jgi:hypothetical protein